MAENKNIPLPQMVDEDDAQMVADALKQRDDREMSVLGGLMLTAAPNPERPISLLDRFTVPG